MFPIVFSSLTAVCLVLIVGRHAGAGWGLAGLAVYLALPMSWVVGWFVGYEPFVLGAMMLAFALHLALRRAPPLAYGLVWLAVFVAFYCDWCGAFVVPAIFVYEVLTPRADRRLLRAFLLGIPVVCAVGTFVLLSGWWRGSLDAGWRRILDNAHTTTTQKQSKGSAGEWLANQWKFWRDLYTVPVTLIAAGALPWFVARCRSATDALPRIALALLLPAVLNVAAFMTHAFDHEFWWAYAIPYAVIAVVVFVRGVTAGVPKLRAAQVGVGAHLRGAARVLAAAVIVGLLCWAGVDRIVTRHRALATTEYRDVGLDMNRFARRNDALLFPGIAVVESFYIDSWYLDTFATASYDAYRGMVDLKKNGGLLVDRIVSLVPEGASPDFTMDNVAKLRELGELRILERTAFEAGSPALARRWPGRRLFVLTIE